MESACRYSDKYRLQAQAILSEQSLYWQSLRMSTASWLCARRPLIDSNYPHASVYIYIYLSIYIYIYCICTYIHIYTCISILYQSLSDSSHCLHLSLPVRSDVERHGQHPQEVPGSFRPGGPSPFWGTSIEKENLHTLREEAISKCIPEITV